MTLTAAVWAGSVPGREHLRVFRNNQDGAAVVRTGERVVAVVTDGCSSGRYSEVGARLGASWLARRLSSGFEQDTEVALANLSEDFVAWLDRLARDLDLSAAELRAIVGDYLLFTFLAAVVDSERFVIFGAGDGAFAIDDRVVRISALDDAPDYLAYRLLGRPVRAVVHASGSSSEIRSIALGTDGAAALLEEGSMLAAHANPSNPALLQRALQRRARECFDDATVALVHLGEPR
jgi:hypothetical protein